MSRKKQKNGKYVKKYANGTIKAQLMSRVLNSCLIDIKEMATELFMASSSFIIKIPHTYKYILDFRHSSHLDISHCVNVTYV